MLKNVGEIVKMAAPMQEETKAQACDANLFGLI